MSLLENDSFMLSFKEKKTPSNHFFKIYLVTDQSYRQRTVFSIIKKTILVLVSLQITLLG